MAKLTKKQEQEKQESIATLREWLKPGDTVHLVLEHVSRSGMMREIKPYAIVNGEMQWLTFHAARALGYRRGKRDGIIMGGCGMDMGFSLVYELSSLLFRNDDRRTKYDGPEGHNNTSGRITDREPGYWLKHHWL